MPENKPVAKWHSGKAKLRPGLAAALSVVLLAQPLGLTPAYAYVLNRTVAASGGCPQPNRFNVATAGIIDRRWSTSLNTNPVTILTTATDATARLDEIEQSVLRSFSVWANVAGASLTPAAYAPIQRTTTQSACTSNDGLNTICFNQASTAFTGGVLAFTRVVQSDIVGEKPFANSPASAFIGEILDADILFLPDDGTRTFATPSALPANTNSFDLESVLIHELGHFFGFSHSGVWRAMMYPFAPPRGTFLGDRPTTEVPDGPLSDDDRTGLRVLYPDDSNTTFRGAISGRILPANILTLSQLPTTAPGEAVTGIFGSHVIAVDAATGSVIAATLGGWSCSTGDAHAKFDGTYILERLPVGRSYKIFVEPFDLPVEFGDIQGAVLDLCRDDVPNNCTVPALQTNFTTRIRP